MKEFLKIFGIVLGVIAGIPLLIFTMFWLGLKIGNYSPLLLLTVFGLLLTLGVSGFIYQNTKD